MPFLYLSFLSRLEEMLLGVFHAVFTPVIKSVTGALFGMVGSLFKDMIYDALLMVFITLLKLVDLLENVFNVFSGIWIVKYAGKDTYFLDMFFPLGSIQKAFLMITFIAAGTAFLFTMYATAKSMSDMALTDKNPISTVMRNAFKSMLSFLLIPLFCIFIVQCATALTDHINKAVVYSESGQREGRMSAVIFAAAATPAAKGSDNVIDFGLDRKYEKMKGVKKSFDIAQIDYVTGYISSVLVIFIMMGAVLLFIRRVIEVLLLYLVAPFFTASIPLDGGGLFVKWRDLFVAKVFSGFGSVFAMKIYFILAPSIVKGTIIFSGNPVLNSCLQVFFVIGGAWAVYKGQHLILQILNPEAAKDAQASTGAMVTLALTAASGAKGVAGGAAKAFAKGKQAAAAGSSLGKVPDAEAGNHNDSQAFRGR